MLICNLKTGCTHKWAYKIAVDPRKIVFPIHIVSLDLWAKDNKIQITFQNCAL